MKSPLFYLALSFVSLLSYAQQKNSIGMEFVKIPSGTFYMGDHGLGENRDEAPVHPVTISKTFLMGATEVTNVQYEQFDPQHKLLRGKYGLSKEDDEAVIFVNYKEAKAFCEWLSAKEGKSYRLPTEAEWEYACKAGTYLPYSMDDGLPAIYQKKQFNVWGVDTTINLKVKTTPANPFGLYDMHGNVEEWCNDWYGPYDAELQIDPVGPSDGLYRVTRGGSHSTPVSFLRSTNRMAMIPEDKHWLTGFRVVLAEMPATEPLPAINDICVKNISQQKYNWKEPCNEAFFEEPVAFVKYPVCPSDVPFYNHNHCPAITWCDNGDLLAIWFSTNDEAGREMTILSSRLRAGTTEWDSPCEFFKVPDRNMTGSSLFNDGNGTLIHINGVEAAGTWKSLIMIMRTSTDNGLTWSIPRIITPEHTSRHQVIAGMFRTKEGWLVQAADATSGGDGGTALHISKDNGKSWQDPGKDIPNDFVEEGTGGSIAGIHAGVVQLSNGDFMAFGRGNNIINKEGIERMPMSLSKDGGKTWTYTASEFPPIDGGQRLVLTRLIEGPILLVSFTNHPYRLKNDLKGMTFTDHKGNEYTGYGMYAALSFDEGKTWPVKRLLTDGKKRFMDGGAWTGFFIMDQCHAEPRGYLAATQTPDHTIHLVSSRNHYRFNLQWLLENTGYRYDDMDFGKVTLTDTFWKKRLDINSKITVPDVLKKCEEYGRIQNFAVAGGVQPGKFIGGASWDDSDLFKALEAASYQYALHKEEHLRFYMDSVISLLQKAQEEDGYLVTAMWINREKNLPWNIRSPRFSYLIWSHELYNFGHLYEAAVAHYQATRQTNLLDIATKNADLLVHTFLRGDSLNNYVDGCPEVEIGLFKLWKITGKSDYLLLMKKLLDLRGDDNLHELYLGYDEGRNPYFFQDYKPVKEFDEALGHGVRALYLYSSMADMGAFINDTTYFSTLNKLWNNMTKYKMYITGGIGSRHKGEAFGDKYELPNMEAYNETCSSIANILWNYRMFKWSGEGKYIDVCERILYNAFLAGWALNGCEYNYVNPLESDGKYIYNKGANKRQAWFETSCCPTNISRFVPQISKMIYATHGEDVYVNLFIAAETTLSLGDNTVDIRMNGNYPWDGKVTLDLEPAKESIWKLHIRVPSWTGHTPLPESDLYQYIVPANKPVSIKVNDRVLNDIRIEKGYAIIQREWKKGDRVTIEMPMPVRCVKTKTMVVGNNGKIALERGPVVYCIEEKDNGVLDNVKVSNSAKVGLQYDPDFLNGVTTVYYDNLKFIPYYSWGNRGANQMKVWLPEK